MLNNWVFEDDTMLMLEMEVGNDSIVAIGSKEK